MVGFSGEMPHDLQSSLEDSLLNASELLNTTMIEVSPATTTIASILPYAPNYYRIVLLTIKCLLTVLVLVLSGTIKRDFLKVFTLILMVPLVFECGFDVYSEVNVGVSHYDSSDVAVDVSESYLYLQALKAYERPGLLPREAVRIYRELLTKYTYFKAYGDESYYALVSFILSDLLFWSTLFSSVVAFYYTHKAIVRPEEINYIPYIWSFLKVQAFPILFTTADTLLATFEVPSYVLTGATAIIRLTACLVAFTMVTQIFASFIVFCRRRSDYTKASPYDQVRDGKWRLFNFILFQLVVHKGTTIPYLAWACISLAQDFLIVFHFSNEDQRRMPVQLANEMFEDHLLTALYRPLVLLCCIILFLMPYRKKFVRFFCPCCRRV